METGNLASSQIQITVSEHGKAVAMTELLLRTAFTNTMRDAAVLLGRHYARDLNERIRDELMTTANSLYAGSKASRDLLGTADTFSVDFIREATTNLAENKVPKFGGDSYICFIHPRQAKDLRTDAAWVNAQNYATPGNILTGEIGRIEDVRFVETTLIKKIDTSGNIFVDGTDSGTDAGTFSTATDVFQAIICGEHCCGHAVSLDVEMRDNGVEDFQRLRKLAWYNVDGLGLIEGGHVFLLETAG